MNALMVLVLALVAPVAALVAFRYFKRPASTRNGVTARCAAVTAFLVLMVSASLLPGARMRDAQAAVDRADLALASRLSEVQRMSEALGSPRPTSNTSRRQASGPDAG